VTTSLQYHFTVPQIGNFALQASWNDELKHTYQMYPGDPVDDELRDPTCCTDFKSKINGSLDWSRGSWASTVYVAWYGRTPNYLATLYGYGTPGAGTVWPWTVAIVTLRYHWTPALLLSVTADNILNAMPPADHSYPGSSNAPYDGEDYNVYGRSYFLEIKYQLPRKRGS